MLSGLEYMSCYQASFIPFLEKRGIDSRFLFLCSGVFQYNVENEMIYDRIHTDYQIPTLDFLKRYFNITVNYNQNDFHTNLLQYQKDDNVIIGIDGYDCPWAPAYGVRHIPHFIYVDEINFDEEMIECKDYYVNKDKIFKISFSSIQEGYKDWTVLQYRGYHNDMSMKELYQLCMKRYHGVKEDMNTQYNQFANDIVKIEELDDLFEYSDVNVCRIVTESYQIRGYQYGMQLLFHYIFHSESTIKLENLYEESGDKWNKVINLLFMLVASKKVRPKVMNMMWQLITELGETEKNILQELQEMYKNT